MESNGVVRPARGWFVVLDGGIVMLSVLALKSRAYTAVSRLVPLPSRSALRRLLVATALIHLAEAVGAGRVARRRGLPARRWALQTLIVGFPSLLALRAAPHGEPATGPARSDHR